MLNILIVDDSAANLMIYTKLSESIDKHVRVSAFKCAQQAITWLMGSRADLIITDYKMPVMTGIQLTRAIRAIPACVDTPVVVTTAYDDRDIRIEALEAGATDFLLTPVDRAEFLPRIRNLLRLSAHQRMARERATELESRLFASERRTDQVIRSNHELILQVIDSVPAMISANDCAGKSIFVNKYQLDVLGQTPIRVLTKRDESVISTGIPSEDLEETITDIDGKTHVFLNTKTPLRDSDGTIFGVITTALDITGRKLAESQLLYQVEHDSLTSIPNRYFVNNWISTELIHNHKPRRPFALYFIDLDRFKNVNDELGHQYGDMLLQAVSLRLKGLIRREDIVARLGGDEFAIIQTGVDHHSQTKGFAKRVTQALETPFEIRDQLITISASVGVTLYPSDGVTAEELLNNADVAMYRVKSQGRNNVECFTNVMREEAQETSKIRTMLRGALERNEFFLVYQPQRDLKTDRVVGFEALLRWQRADGCVVSPTDFLPIAEDIGLMPAIDDWVLNEACRQAKIWHDTHETSYRIAINLSAPSFCDPDLSSRITRALTRTMLPPKHLEVELTESIMITNNPICARQLETLRRTGARIAIDDFGTGYSELARLAHLQVDTLKIDKSFISNLGSARSSAIVSAIIGLGRALNVDILAEGVEADHQLKALRALGCDSVQGYFTGRPQSAADVVKLMGLSGCSWRNEASLRGRATMPV